MQVATEIKFHEVCTIFPEMSADELQLLADDIRENGLRESIWTFSGRVIDGRNRLKACEIADVEPTFREWSGAGDPVVFALSLNRFRRHLSPSQRAQIAVDAKRLLQKEIYIETPQKVAATKNAALGDADGLSILTKRAPAKARNARKEAAKAMGVSDGYLHAAEKIAEKSPETAAKVKSGELTIPQAKKELGLTSPKATGKCKINGVVVDDPPDIAKKRAQGKIAAGVIPEIDQPEEVTTEEEVREAFEERAAMGNEALSDEDWLATLPIRSLLTGSRQAAFDADALLYRNLTPHRKTFGHHNSLVAAKTDKLRGPYYWRIKGFLSTNHPDKWLLCPAMADGGCGGTGVVPMLGECIKCSSKGYRLR